MMAKSYAQLKTKLDQVFSKFVRTQRAGPSGIARCVTCGAASHWKWLHAGHFISRVHLATRWEDRNVHPQCARCNNLLRGNPDAYRRYLERRYGDAIIADLEAQSRRPVKYSCADLFAMIQHYGERVKCHS
jgi:hypothetical protein